MAGEFSTNNADFNEAEFHEDFTFPHHHHPQPATSPSPLGFVNGFHAASPMSPGTCLSSRISQDMMGDDDYSSSGAGSPFTLSQDTMQLIYDPDGLSYDPDTSTTQQQHGQEYLITSYDANYDPATPQTPQSHHHQARTPPPSPAKQSNRGHAANPPSTATGIHPNAKRTLASKTIPSNTAAGAVVGKRPASGLTPTTPTTPNSNNSVAIKRTSSPMTPVSGVPHSSTTKSHHQIPHAVVGSAAAKQQTSRVPHQNLPATPNTPSHDAHQQNGKKRKRRSEEESSDEDNDGDDGEENNKLKNVKKPKTLSTNAEQGTTPAPPRRGRPPKNGGAASVVLLPTQKIGKDGQIVDKRKYNTKAKRAAAEANRDRPPGSEMALPSSFQLTKVSAKKTSVVAVGKSSSSVRGRPTKKATSPSKNASSVDESSSSSSSEESSDSDSDSSSSESSDSEEEKRNREIAQKRRGGTTTTSTKKSSSPGAKSTSAGSTTRRKEEVFTIPNIVQYEPMMRTRAEVMEVMDEGHSGPGRIDPALIDAVNEDIISSSQQEEEAAAAVVNNKQYLTEEQDDQVQQQQYEQVQQEEPEPSSHLSSLLTNVIAPSTAFEESLNSSAPLALFDDESGQKRLDDFLIQQVERMKSHAATFAAAKAKYLHDFDTVHHFFDGTKFKKQDTFSAQFITQYQAASATMVASHNHLSTLRNRMKKLESAFSSLDQQL